MLLRLQLWVYKNTIWKKEISKIQQRGGVSCYTVVILINGGFLMAQIFGYARVSTREQNEARQLLALREFGVEDERIFTDRQSGKDFDRPAYRRLVRRLRPGDTLAVKSIDRLGRNYREILEQWRILTHERRVGVVVLDMPLLDTRQERDLAGTLTADIVCSFSAMWQKRSVPSSVNGRPRALPPHGRAGRRSAARGWKFRPHSRRYTAAGIAAR